MQITEFLSEQKGRRRYVEQRAESLKGLEEWAHATNGVLGPQHWMKTCAPYPSNFTGRMDIRKILICRGRTASRHSSSYHQVVCMIRDLSRINMKLCHIYLSCICYVSFDIMISLPSQCNNSMMLLNWGCRKWVNNSKMRRLKAWIRQIADCTTGEKVRSLYKNEWFVDFPCSIDLQFIVIFSATRQFSTVILISNVQLEGT